jgi:hypothetical protein
MVIVQTEYDDNVFRSAVQPVSDIVSTVGGKINGRAQLRRIGLTAGGAADWVHYSKLARQRGANVGAEARLDLFFNRFVPYLGATYGNSRQRVNPEIDGRPRLIHSSIALGGILRMGGKTGLDVSAARSSVGYTDYTTPEGVSVSGALNRTSDQLTLSIVREVTPLTRVITTGEIRRETFTQSTQRNSDFIRLGAGFESTSRVRGRATAGVLFHKPQSPTLPESQGFFASVGTVTTLLDRLQIGVDVNRDVAPSYRPEVPYYKALSYGGSLAFAVRRSLRLSALADRRHADYRGERATGPAAHRFGVEIETKYGSSVVYLIGNSLAIHVSGAYVQRTAPVAWRQFEGVNFVSRISHVF